MNLLRLVLNWLTGGLPGALHAVWRAALRNPWRALTVWFTALFLISQGLLHHERASNRQLRGEIKEIAKKQQQARRDQQAVNHAPVIVSQAIAQESRAHEKAIYEAGRAAGAAYADAHRVRASAVVGPVGRAGLPGANRPSEKHDGAGEVADLVAITAADFDTCTVNSQRLAQVHADGEALIAAGIAVPDMSKGAE